jgi:uncharacterized protein (TIGR04255 family)
VPDQPYKQPPITEAVIEIRFAAPIDTARIAEISADFQSLYPYEQRITDVRVQLYLPSAPQATTTAEAIEKLGHKRSSLDQTQILLLWPQNLIVSQLAPYPGWEVFFDRFRRDWTMWKRLMDYRKISRIGVRYINRIDIPVSGTIVEHEQYLNLYPHLPEAFGNVRGYGVQAQVVLPDIDCMLILNSLSVPSPLLGHAAFIVDQDIANEINPPQSDEAIYELLNRVRTKKNEIFEACITPRARELFKPWQD